MTFIDTALAVTVETLKALLIALLLPLSLLIFGWHEFVSDAKQHWADYLHNIGVRR